MEEYNVLVLMEKDKENGYFTQTVDSYIIESGIELVEGLYLLEEGDSYYVYMTLTTRDVEDWEYYGIYELYDEELYNDLGVEITGDSDSYNPSWVIKFEYSQDRQPVSGLLNTIIKLHQTELERIAPLLIENKDKYIEESKETE